MQPGADTIIHIAVSKAQVASGHVSLVRLGLQVSRGSATFLTAYFIHALFSMLYNVLQVSPLLWQSVAEVELYKCGHPGIASLPLV